MNSYNENLHSTVVTSLNDLETELQKAQAQLDASKFSLYYAQGARITAAEKVELSCEKYDYDRKLQEQAVVDSDLSTNVLASSNNTKSYVAQSVTNTSVAAANVQIAANAILKLASDTGSIFSIVNAADFDTDIYSQSKMAYNLMNETAYLAEKASQHSMEASASIAEVPSESLATKATTTDTSVKNLLSVVTAQFEAASATLEADNTALAAADVTEKAAEGVLEDQNVSFNATQDAYNLNNQELNLDLKVKVPSMPGDATNYTVSFTPYVSPFYNVTDIMQGSFGYPVQNYYIMLVKYTKKSTFSVSEAESLVTDDDSNRYIKLNPSLQQPLEVSTKNNEISGFENLKTPIITKIYTSELLDTDGDKMNLGDNYVVFVFAEFKTEYKKLINTFDDYLSAPSAEFTLTNQLSRVVSNTIKVAAEVESDQNHDPAIGGIEGIGPQKLTFEVAEEFNYNVLGDTDTGTSPQVEYRCMFLPDNPDLVTGLLTADELASLEEETTGLEKIANIFDPLIADLSTELNTITTELTGVTSQIAENEKIINDSTSSVKDKNKAKRENVKLKLKKTQLEASQVITELLLTIAINEKQEQIDDMESKKTHVKPGFFFDLSTAEQVHAGSYTTATMSMVFEPQQEAKTDEATEQPIQISKLTKGVYHGEMTLAPETTDNFGNRLIDGDKYIPVILAVYNNDSASVNKQFTNSLSNYQKTASFVYKSTVSNASYSKTLKSIKSTT